jgi:TIR domain/Effector-associated domain 9
MKDFFVSYNKADKQWAEWIAWQLEEAGYSVIIQAWDFRPGGNFVLEMQKAATESHQTIAVLSEAYLKASFTQPEWAAAFASDPQSLKRKLLPVRVKKCELTGLLAPLIYVDLVDLEASAAQQTLLGALVARAKPEKSPGFPGSSAETEHVREILTPQRFPTALNRVQKVKESALQKQLNNLIEDYDAANEQLGYSVNLVDQQKLQRQIMKIAEEMDKVAAELDGLGV